MSALHIAEAFCALVAFVLADGSLWRRRLDDRDRARMVAAHDRDEDQVCNAFAVQLEELRNLPTTEHPPLGWSS